MLAHKDFRLKVARRLGAGREKGGQKLSERLAGLAALSLMGAGLLDVERPYQERDGRQQDEGHYRDKSSGRAERIEAEITGAGAENEDHKEYSYQASFHR
jgi:hypothetical protein